MPVFIDLFVNSNGVKRVTVVTSKIYYELIKERSVQTAQGWLKPNAIAFMCVENLAPFLFTELREVIVDEYYGAFEHFWV